MYATGNPTTSTPDGETLQDLLNALTKPPKWMVETSTQPGATSSVFNDSWTPKEEATWRATPSVLNDSWTPKAEATWRDGVGTLSRLNQTVNSTTWPFTAGNNIVTGALTTTDGDTTSTTINKATEFWYKYGISITVAVLVIVVAVVLIIQCRMVHQKRLRRRSLVDLIQSGKVKRADKAREQIFESFHRQATNEFVNASRLNTAPAAQQEEIPMRHLAHHHDAPHRSMAPVIGQGMMEPLARVYPLSFEPVCPRDCLKNTNPTDPYQYDNRRLWNTTTAGLYPIRAHRSVLSEPAIARPSSRRYSSRNRIKRIPTRGDYTYRLPQFNLSGKRIVTSPETNAFLRMRNREVPHHTVAYAEPNSSTLLMELSTPTPKLIVPTNTPNTHCTDSGGDNASPHGPGLDSDFGASAGIPHFTVSPHDSMNAEDTASARDASYEWDSYDPAYMNRTVSYVDGAYFPILHRKQYWV